MTESDVVGVMGYINQRWPHAPLEAHALPVWREDLEDQPFAEAMVAVRSWARSGERFPPTSGWVRSEVQRGAQAPAPSFDDALVQFERALSGFGVVDARGPEDTMLAIEHLAQRGVHEVVLRWVQAVGIYTARFTPDPTMHGLDMNQSADRRDLARNFDRRIVPEWRADPRPGVALDRARTATTLSDGDLRQLLPGDHRGEPS